MLAELIKIYIGPLLSRAGFKKKGMIWNRSTDRFVQVLEVQRGSKRADGSISFTLNIGIWIDKVWFNSWGKPPTKFIKEEDCFPRFRVGFLLDNFNPRFRDVWWLLSEQNINEVGDELCKVMETKCLPFFANHNSINQVLEFTEQKLPIMLPLDKLYLAVLQFLEGNAKAAQCTFSKLEADPHWGKKTLEIKKRLNETC